MGLLKTDAAKAAWASASFNVEQNDAAKETAKAEKEAAKAEKADAKVARQAAKKEAKAEKVAEKAAAHLAEVTWIKIFNNVTGGLTGDDYYAVAESGVPEKDALNDPDTPVYCRKKGGRKIGRLADFKVTVPGLRTHGSAAAVGVFGDWGLGARRTAATIVVQCGEHTTSYVVAKLTNMESKILYRQIAENDARLERLNPAGAVAAVQAPSAADDLRQLNQLHDDGLLTDGEFAAKRAEVIGRI